MSEKKTQAKVADKPKSKPAEKSESGKKDVDKSVADGGTSSTESTGAAPKSASQTSISHFSSVSTPAYKTGWDSIFGGSETQSPSKIKTLRDDDLPDQLAIDDDDIDAELRAALYKIFQKKARKQGISLAQLKKRASISYGLTCDIEER